MESCTKQINVIVWGEGEELARTVAGCFGTKASGQDIWENSINGATVKTYVRWANGVPTQAPKGVTDALLAVCTESAPESLSDYVDQRRGIPQKYLVSSSQLASEADNLKLDYVSLNELQEGYAIFKIVDSAVALNETLKNVFKKIDLDGDGSLTADEIITASSELKHVLTSEDAKEIANTLSTEGKVTFEQFKQWWVVGRSDLRSFRRLVALEMRVNNFLKSSKGVTITSMFEKLKKETEEAAAQETSLENKVNIVPVEDFESGTALRLHLNLGNSFDSISEDIGKTGTVGVVSLELKLKNAEAGKEVIECLNQVKEMAKSFIPEAESIIDKEVMIRFRQAADSVFVDLSYEGENAESICFVVAMMGANSINFSGQSDLHICSKLSPVDLISIEAEQLISSISNLKIVAHGEYSHLKNIVNFGKGLLCSMEGVCCEGGLDKFITPIMGLAQLLVASRKIDFGLKYDSESLTNFLKDLGAHKKQGHDTTRLDRLKEKLVEGQAKAQAGIEGGKMMAGMFLAPFLPAITNINWDNISVSLCSQLIRAHVKLSIGIRGLDGFVASFLQQ
jgi:hypothetical protein